MESLDLEVLEGNFSVCRLAPDADLPAWASEGNGFRAVVRTPEELSLVCNEGIAPEGVEASGGWRALRVAGTLDLSLTGVLLALLRPLEDAGIPIFAISTFDTDYVLVPSDRIGEAKTALKGAGHVFGDRAS